MASYMPLVWIVLNLCLVYVSRWLASLWDFRNTSDSVVVPKYDIWHSNFDTSDKVVPAWPLFATICISIMGIDIYTDEIMSWIFIRVLYLSAVRLVIVGATSGYISDIYSKTRRRDHLTCNNFSDLTISGHAIFASVLALSIFLQALEKKDNAVAYSVIVLLVVNLFLIVASGANYTSDVLIGFFMAFQSFSIWPK